MQSDLIRISDEVIDLQETYRALSDRECGAQLVFVGVVRDENEGRRVATVSYDAFVPLAQKTLLELAQEVRQRISSPLRLVLLHRLGRLRIGEVSAVVGVSSPHRAESYDASRYLIEQLKGRLPVWKEECYVDGEKKWLGGAELTAEGGGSDTRGRTLIAHGGK